MKKLFFLACILVAAGSASAQEFNKKLSEAKAAYTAGKLDDARFAMQQMLQELDIITGKEVLKLLPAKMMDQSPNSVNDNVSGASGYFGVMIHRDYGPETKQIELDVLGNSPMLAGINTLLSLPLIGNNADQKVIRIAGYKALVQRQSGENNTYNYEVSLPINNNLITLKAPGYSQDEVIKMANSLPVAEIAKMMQ